MKELQHLLNKLNKVTAYHRHGHRMPSSALDDLANAQIEYEKAIQVQAKVKPANGEREEFEKFEAELYSKYLDEFKDEFDKLKCLTPNNIFNWIANQTWRKSRLSG